MTRSIAVLCALMPALASAAASAQNFPNRPIRIVTSGVGGGSDFVARLVANGIAGPLGQSVIVDNRANSTIAAEFVVKQPPDGYTLMSWGSAMWVGPLLREAPYDAVRDFQPVILVSSAPSIVTVNAAVPVKSVKELIALARAKPGTLNYSSNSVGSPSHLAVELFKSMAKLDIVAINYKGSGPAVTATLAGETQINFANAAALLPHIKSGKLRALAVTGGKPFAMAPDLPTVAAAGGLTGYDVASADVILAPAKLPAPILARLYQEIARYVQTPEAREKLLTGAGSEVVAGTPEQLATLIKTDIAVMAKLIKDANIKIE